MYQEMLERKTQPLLIVISGPSGVGKDTVIQHMKERSLPFHFVVTATSRPKRSNEIEGVDYFFVTHQEFTEMIETGELLEYAVVYEDYKGIPKKQVHDALSSGSDVVMRVDVQGAKTIRGLYPEALLIFLSGVLMVTRLLRMDTPRLIVQIQNTKIKHTFLIKLESVYSKMPGKDFILAFSHTVKPVQERVTQ